MITDSELITNNNNLAGRRNSR